MIISIRDRHNGPLTIMAFGKICGRFDKMLMICSVWVVGVCMLFKFSVKYFRTTPFQRIDNSDSVVHGIEF
jgi:hypothetical protein